ncbi:MAG: hypothetical protein IPN90_06715 [Elusimicrobia bacterium]|nr:hypothetical protein [Elusimicrobiota bacterium]
MSQRDIYQLPEKQKAETSPWARMGVRLGAGLILLGIVVAGIAGGSVLSTITRGSHQVQFPGSVNLKLKSGLYVGLPAPKSDVANAALFVTVTEVSTGESVPVQMGSDMTVAVEGPAGGRPLFQFETFDAGVYMVSGTASTPTGRVAVLILHESLGRTRSDLVVGLLAGTLLVVSGGLLIWAVRRKQKRFEPAG